MSLGLHYNGVNSYLFVNKTEIYKFKADNGTVNFPTQFCAGSISDEFGSNDIKGISLNGNVYDFSVDFNAILKSDILDIHKYLMNKDNIK